MKFTENFNLNLPDLDDMADVEKLNENFQTIDTTMKSLETDPELAANVVDIKNKIGTESDADTQPTLFGRLAQTKNVLLEKLAEVLTKVTGIDTKIGTSGDTAGTATLFGQVKDISKNMPKGSVKSIQRGEVNYREYEDEIKIPISAINPDKCFVILNVTGDINSSDKGGFLNGAILRKITATELTIYTRARNITNLTMWISWQVIELL